MAFARFVWLMGGAGSLALAAVFSTGACSSSSSGNSSSGSGSSSGAGEEAGSDTGSSSGSSSGSGSGSGSSSGSGSGSSSGSNGDAGDAGCEPPPKLYPQSAAGVYCPFLPADAGSNGSCAPGQHCCESPASSGAPSTCVAAGTACPSGSIDWQCSEAIDCAALDAGTPACCITGATTMTVSSCGQSWTEWTNFTGTTCMASCPSPGYVECQANTDCTGDAGATCTASKSNGGDFGYCTP